MTANKKYFKQSNPFLVPVDDNKKIEEHFGAASTKQDDHSIAHMIAPPGWGEPAQTPEFDEYTLMVSGKKLIKIDGEKIVLEPGESILVKKGTRVRYSNPYEKPAEYWSLCIPAFTFESVHRED